MRTEAELLLAPVVFAMLAVFAYRKLNVAGLIVLSLGWLAALTAWILASVPDPQMPLHDFERTPAPALFGALAGTAAATVLILRRRQSATPRITVLSTAGVYLAFSLFVTLAASLWIMIH